MPKIKFWGLDHFIDIKPLEDLHYEICRGLTLAKGGTSASVYVPQTRTRIEEVKDDQYYLLTNDEQKFFQTLDYNQKRRFMMFYKGAYMDGEFIPLRMTVEEGPFNTFKQSSTMWTKASFNFPNVKKWIETLPFKEIGRVEFFVTYNGLNSQEHWDRRDDWLDGRYHFLHFNPFHQKKFFMKVPQFGTYPESWDSYTEKYYLNDKINFYDTGWAHGADATLSTTYTLRIDGQLTEQFCRDTNIPWKQR